MHRIRGGIVMTDKHLANVVIGLVLKIEAAQREWNKRVIVDDRPFNSLFEAAEMVRTGNPDLFEER
jgi:hypothetical protein